VHRGELTLRWRFDASLEQHWVETLAGCCREQLLTLIDHCCSDEAGGLTPSDVAGLDLDQQGLDALLDTLL